MVCFWEQLLNPIEFLDKIVVEREYVESTGAAIEALVLFKELYPTHRKQEIDNFIVKAVRYIEETQTEDGSWYGCWGICFIYGTYFAVRGLAVAGKTYDNCASIRKGANFLLTTQIHDGGWGESYISCPEKVHYIFNLISY